MSHVPFKMGTKIFHSISFIFDAKKNKETLMTWLGGNTITETKTFVRMEKFAWQKKPLN